MSEIERAIETIKEDYETAIEYGDDERAVVYGNTLKLLRAELDREKNPLTCDGCKHGKGRMSDASFLRCLKCIRQHGRTDRYEPKGEKG